MIKQTHYQAVVVSEDENGFYEIIAHSEQETDALVSELTATGAWCTVIDASNYEEV